jgi:large subunit ribosomal protein L23
MAKEIHVYDVIRRPIITEKSNLLAEQNQYVFEVALKANKIQIKEAVELLFDVKVLDVNTAILPAKRGRRIRRYYIRKPNWKKAIVMTKKPISLFEQ